MTFDGIGGTDSARISDATLDLIRKQAMQMHANGNVSVANGILLQLAILDELRAIRARMNSDVACGFKRAGS